MSAVRLILMLLDHNLLQAAPNGALSGLPPLPQKELRMRRDDRSLSAAIGVGLFRASADHQDDDTFDDWEGPLISFLRSIARHQARKAYDEAVAAQSCGDGDLTKSKQFNEGTELKE